METLLTTEKRISVEISQKQYIELRNELWKEQIQFQSEQLTNGNVKVICDAITLAKYNIAAF